MRRFARRTATNVPVAWRQRSRRDFGSKLIAERSAFDIVGEIDDDGRSRLPGSPSDLGSAAGIGEWRGLSFLRAGEESLAAASSGLKRGVRVRAQMPGKIIRIPVKAGDVVEKGQSLLVMEAMKMENEIRATQSGSDQALKVNPRSGRRNREAI